MRQENPTSSSSIIPILVLGGVGYYAYSQGWLANLFNMFGSGSSSAANVLPNLNLIPAPLRATPANTTTTTVQPSANILDLTGLVTRSDVNDSLTGVVKINGVDTTLSIITGDGRIFNTSGAEITSDLVAKGIDVNYLRTAFVAAKGLSGGKGLGQIFNWNDFFSMQPHKKVLTGNFR